MCGNTQCLAHNICPISSNPVCWSPKSLSHHVIFHIPSFFGAISPPFTPTTLPTLVLRLLFLYSCIKCYMGACLALFSYSTYFSLGHILPFMMVLTTQCSSVTLSKVFSWERQNHSILHTFTLSFQSHFKCSTSLLFFLLLITFVCYVCLIWLFEDSVAQASL